MQIKKCRTHVFLSSVLAMFVTPVCTAGVAAVAEAITEKHDTTAPSHGAKHTYTKPPKRILSITHPLLVAAAPTLFAPSGFAADWGTVFVGGTYVNRWPGGVLEDGNVTAGLGLGDGERYVGLTATALIDSVGVNEPFAKNGSISLQAFRWITPRTAVSFGAANVGGWGALQGTSTSYFGAITQLLPLINTAKYQLPLDITAGVGTGAFSTKAQFLAGLNNQPTGFVSTAFGVLPRANVIVDYTSQLLSAGVSFMPLPTVPAVFTFYATNLAGANLYPGPVTFGARLALGYCFL